MLKIRALNRESSSDEDTPTIRKEAQEEIALELYTQALKLQSLENFSEAEEILLNLINENIPQLESNGGLPSSMSTLKYSCCVNLGSIYMKTESFDKALDYFLNASELDSTDVTLWHKIGKLALQQNRFRQSALAFAKGLECSESHWPCLDQLISILYALRHTIDCLEFISKALALNPDYTKGLVIRRQIYKDNPYTLPYYQKYNPDSIYDPPLDVPIDESDARLILEKEQILFAKITEVEKSAGPKCLQTIPLPTPLVDFTWVSLAKVVIDVHQYLTDNGMSHFTFVDLDKCMSQKGNTEEKVEEEEIVQEKPEEIIPEEAPPEEMEVETIVLERRPSQNSENNNEQENTPIQTDNDEEQAMEQDGEEQDENADNKTDKNRKSSSNKRKRDLLSDLQIWGWHSKRKSAKKGKSDKDFTVEDALNRIIPNHLLRNKIGEDKFQNEDSMNTMDVYNIYEGPGSILSPIHSPASTEETYFGTEREKEDILGIWNKPREYCDSIVLIRDFVYELSKLWHIKWPKELVQMYIDAFSMYREHFNHPQYASGESPFSEIKDDFLATLLFGELVNFSAAKSETRSIHVTSLAFLQYVSGWENEWKLDFCSVFLRVQWLRCHFFRKEGRDDIAVGALELETMQEEEKKSERFFLHLPNCLKCSVISNETVSKILKHLDMITSLNCIEELYNNEKYQEVAEVLKLTFNGSGNHPAGKMGRPAQLGMLLHSLWYTDITQCFVWTEECLYEGLGQFLKPTKNADKWEKVVEKCLLFLQEIIKMETVCVIDALSEDKRARLVETLCKIVCKQLNVESTVKGVWITPWVVLHYVLLREEHRQLAKRKVSHIKKDKPEDSNEEPQDELPPSAAILFSAHEFLGPKGWCLTSNGELLHFILDEILDRLDTPIFEFCREKIDIHIEQAMFCLYQHPSKKNKVSRHLADHNVDPLPLTWERAFQLYDFYGPDCLPEFNSYKNASISSDLEQLLQRITALVPPEMDPQPHMAKLLDFIQGKVSELSEPINFSPKMRAIYYLIGDYYFKQREFNRCLKYFMMDLCINPNRIDSWACIGLSYLSQLENKLNYCKKLKNEMEFLDKAKCAQICFKKALDLEKDHIMLWIEFGSFEYMVHSFCSRLMKTESDTLSMERFEYLENQKNSYLESSGHSFEKAIQLYQPDETEADERWLQYYILGKVAEKQQQEPQEYLKYYVTASKLLHENHATYPEKINYHNTQHLSVEALELHYRIHASVLKYLELHEGKDIPNTIGNIFKEYLDKSYFLKKNVKQPSIAANKITESSEKIMKDVQNCLEDILNKVDSLLQPKVNSNGDVIMISDSDDEQSRIPQNVQEMLDKMMEETMKKTEDQEPDSDTSLTSKNVVEVKPEEPPDIRTSVEETSSSPSSSSSSSSSDSDTDDDTSTTTSTTSSGTTTGNMSNNDIMALIDRCISGLEQCIVRLPQNYKALYRLAHLYFYYKNKKDVNKSKQLLLGEYKCKDGMIITGLFSDRKNHNFFNGIWRIPSSEIDRPGSLSAHMSRCITLLLQVSRASNDSKLLLDLSMQFKKTPDPDKIYIKDSERIQFSDQAMTMCVQSLRSQIQNLTDMDDSTLPKLLQEIYRSYQRVQKHDTSKESLFAAMLTDAYKKIKIKIPENANVLDLAIKFCQQTRIVEKQKRQMQQSQAVLARPGPPVLSAPAPVTTAPPQPPLKRPGMGRPRGRPPLPKVPGQQRVPRARNPNIAANQFSWQKTLMDQNAAYNYLKKYQEELIKQYSQSLNLNQLTQLSQYFTQSQASNVFQNQFANQFMAGLSSSANLMPPMMNDPNKYKNIGVSEASKPPVFSKKKEQMMALAESLKAFDMAQSVGYKKPQPAKPKTSLYLNQPMNLGNKPVYVSKPETITHSVTSMSQAAVTKSKSLYTSSSFKNYPGVSFAPAAKGGAAITKTTASSQIFKEPLLSKPAHHKIPEKTANLLMKDRPNISITPVMQSPVSFINTSFMSPTKTLQEKLADKQKQHVATKQVRSMEAEIISAPMPVKKPVNIPSIPTKSLPYKFPMDSGISISQIPVTQPYKNIEAMNLQRKEKLTKISKLPPEIRLIPNLPISLSVKNKKPPERKPSSDDDVIIIE